jgi:predicted RNA-binding Zn-ribbon protein involved in translation (DUF1610 family)
MSFTTDDVEEQRKCLERAVAADPANTAARRGLVMLSEKLDRSRLVKEGETVAPRHPTEGGTPTEPEEVEGRAYQCSSCGGRITFNIARQELACPYCGYIQETEKRLAADEAEQVVDFVMPTTRLPLGRGPAARLLRAVRGDQHAPARPDGRLLPLLRLERFVRSRDDGAGGPAGDC